MWAFLDFLVLPFGLGAVAAVGWFLTAPSANESSEIKRPSMIAFAVTSLYIAANVVLVVLCFGGEIIHPPWAVLEFISFVGPPVFLVLFLAARWAIPMFRYSRQSGICCGSLVAVAAYTMWRLYVNALAGV